MLLEWKTCELIEMNIQVDHIHLIISVPPKVSIFQLMGVLKVKSYWGNHFWSRGYCVDTIGLDKDKIKRYVNYQEAQEKLEKQQPSETSVFSMDSGISNKLRDTESWYLMKYICIEVP